MTARTKLFIASIVLLLISFGLALLSAYYYPGPFSWVYGLFACATGVATIICAIAGADSKL